jgi:hypothetical protein
MEEARALRWDHVDLDGNPATDTPPHIDVWRSVRAGGDTKTRATRAALALPELGVRALSGHPGEAEDGRALGSGRAGVLHPERRNGGPLDAGNVRRSFKRICEAAERLAGNRALCLVGYYWIWWIAAFGSSRRRLPSSSLRKYSSSSMWSIFPETSLA